MTGYEHDAQRVKGGVSRGPAVVYGPGAANRLIQPPKHPVKARSLTLSMERLISVSLVTAFSISFWILC